MARISKSQWEFDGLFPSEPARKVLTVSELTWQVRRLLEQQVGEVWVTGEITNRRLQSSGHIYFTLKDAGAQLSCVLFRGETQADRALVQDGRKVNLRGEVTVYEPRGQYQLRVMKVELQGVGALQAAFEKLKQKLKAEGLFAPERKRPLPRYPLRIGVATSPTGAALRDVLHVVERRHPALELILAPCRVQGEGAAAEIAAAVRLLNEFNRAAAAAGDRSGGVDLILVTRGGGSLEDLWAFNEEVVARAIFESALPVVSAVGHEIDFSISDFVADVRAATPSAAAEIITEGVFASGQFLSEAPRRLRQSAAEQWEDKRRDWAEAAQRLARMHPRRRLNDWLQRLDDAQTGLLRCLRQGMRQQRQGWHNLAERLWRVRPAALWRQKREGVQLAEQRLREQGRRLLEARRAQLDALAARLRLLGPEQVLARGYSITSDAASGKVLRAADEVKPGQRLRTRLKTGEILSQAEG
ncbi:MAG: exodeoxyribonuclease VII large subunit [Verrucomicrobia bacterium]|nr:exodeoxyribonuclease VII large subunit [Verrucomicrobiota bacterium]MDI9371833.1 exodeoxyribonuclease VII large subunit [Verrucomicrobiota bacterium]HPW93212.1 exodeoxyribonuclease VII large subunit [Verrucomicrobiota bacterium]